MKFLKFFLIFLSITILTAISFSNNARFRTDVLGTLRTLRRTTTCEHRIPIFRNIDLSQFYKSSENQDRDTAHRNPRGISRFRYSHLALARNIGTLPDIPESILLDGMVFRL